MFSPPPSPLVVNKTQQDVSPPTTTQPQIPITTKRRRSTGARGLVLLVIALVLVFIAATTRYVVKKSAVEWDTGLVLEVVENGGDLEVFPRTKRQVDLAGLVNDGTGSAASSAPTGPVSTVPWSFFSLVFPGD